MSVFLTGCFWWSNENQYEIIASHVGLFINSLMLDFEQKSQQIGQAKCQVTKWKNGMAWRVYRRVCPPPQDSSRK